jgi:WD40 repeat protein
MVILWDLETGLSTVYPGHTAAVRDVEFNPDSSKFASASRDHLVVIWEVDPDSQRQPLASFPGHIDGVNALSWSPDGERLASGSDDGTIVIWDMEIAGDK